MPREGVLTYGRINSANIEIARPDGTDPVSIVKYADGRLAQNGFDRKRSSVALPIGEQ
jgi:hypothetical protein